MKETTSFSSRKRHVPPVSPSSITQPSLRLHRVQGSVLHQGEPRVDAASLEEYLSSPSSGFFSSRFLASARLGTSTISGISPFLFVRVSANEPSVTEERTAGEIGSQIDEACSRSTKQDLGSLSPNLTRSSTKLISLSSCSLPLSGPPTKKA